MENHMVNGVIVIFILAGLFGFVLAPLWNRKDRTEMVCPKCGSDDLEITNRETLASRTIETWGGGTPAGGDIRLQLDLEVTYHCQKCGGKIVRKFTETQ